MKYFIPLLLFLSIIQPIPAMAHRPYVRQLTGWLPYDGAQYRLEGWFGDGILIADPVRVILRDKDGNAKAITGIGRPPGILGRYPDIDCSSLSNCWVFLDTLDGSGSLSWQLNPNALALVKIPTIPPSGPKDWTEDIVGFEAKKHPGGILYHHFGKVILLLIFSVLISARYIKKKRSKVKAA